jgi:hypothetical protein
MAARRTHTFEDSSTRRAGPLGITAIDCGPWFDVQPKSLLYSPPMKTGAAVLLLGCSSLACSSATPEPAVASSAGQTLYAESYPASLQSVANSQLNSEGIVKTLTSDFNKYPDQLKDAPWPRVLVVVEQADEAGRSTAFVDQEKATERTATFFADEHEDITRKVAGAVQYAAKKKEYDFEAYGPVSGSLKDAVDKNLEKRQRAINDAQLTIERYRDTLGKANAAALEKQADAISLASYLTYVKLPSVRAQTVALVGEADQVRKTLDRALAEEQTFAAEPGHSAAEKKASAERSARLTDAKGRVDAALAQAQALAKDQEQRNAQTKKAYDDALDALKKAISTKGATK